MPDVTIGVKVEGAAQAAGQLQQVGSAASQAGQKAGSAGSSFSSMGSRLAGAAGGAGILVGGMFALEDSITHVQQADVTAAKARQRAVDATQARQKAEAALKNEIEGTTTATKNSNGQVDTEYKKILSVNTALGTETVQRKKANGEISITTEKAGAASDAQQKYADSVQKEANAWANSDLQATEASHAHERLGFNIAGNIATMAGGIGTMIGFAKGMGNTGSAASTAAKGLEESKSSLASNAGSLLKVALPLAAVAAGYVILKNNIGGSRDALNSIGVSIGKAVPAMVPVLNIFKGIGEAIGIQAGPGLERVQKSFAELNNVLAPVKAKLGEIASTFSAFFHQLSIGDISGAFSIAKLGLTKFGTDVMTALKSINWSAVWQGLQDAFNSSVNFITTAAKNIGGSISNLIKTWNWGDTWKSLQDAFWSSVNFLKNVTVPIQIAARWLWDNFIAPTGAEILKHITLPQITKAVDLSIQWIIKNVVDPTIAELKKQLPTYTAAISNGVPLLVEWLITGKTDPTKAELDKWKPVIGSQDLFVPAIINWSIGSHKDPTPAQIDASKPIFRKQAQDVFVDLLYKVAGITPPTGYKPPTIPKQSQEVLLDLKAKVEKFDMPKIDTAVSGLYDNIASAIKNAPAGAKNVGEAIREGVFSFFPKSIDAKEHPITIDNIKTTIGQATDLLADFTKWFEKNMPKSMTSAQDLILKWNSIDWSGMTGTILNTAKDIGAFIQNALRNEIAKIPLIGQSLAAAIPPIKFHVETELGDTYKQIDELKAKLKDPTLTKQQRIDILLNISDLEKKLPGLWTELKKIPPELLSTFKADTTQPNSVLPGLHQSMTTAAPPSMTTSFVANTANASQKISGYEQAFLLIPSSKQSILQADDTGGMKNIAEFTNAANSTPGTVTTTLDLKDKPANVSLNTWIQNLLNGVPKSVLTQLAFEATKALGDASNAGHQLHTLIPGTVPSKLSLDPGDTKQKAGDFNHNLGVMAPPNWPATKLQVDPSKGTADTSNYKHSSLDTIPLGITTFVKADVSQGRAQIGPYMNGDIRQIPETKSTDVLANTALAVAALASFITTSLRSIPPYVPIVLVTDAREAAPAIATFVNQTLGTIPRSIVIYFTANTTGADSSIIALNAAIQTVTTDYTTTFHAATNQATTDLKAYIELLKTVPGTLTTTTTFHAETGGIYALKAREAAAATRIMSSAVSADSPPISGSGPTSGQATNITPISGSGGQSYNVAGKNVSKFDLPPNTYGAAKGGSFIVSSPTMIGNLQVGEGHKPELLTYMPFQGGGGGLLNVQPLTGPNKPRGTKNGLHMKEGGFANLHNIGHDIGSVNTNASGMINHLVATVEKLVSTIQKNEAKAAIGSNKSMNTNLIVDGQRMSSVVQKYIGKNSYGDR